MNYRVASHAVSGATLSPSDESKLLGIQLGILFDATLFCPIFTNLRFTALLPNRTDIVTSSPKRPAPQLLFDAGHTAQNFTRGETLDDPDTLRWPVTRNALP